MSRYRTIFALKYSNGLKPDQPICARKPGAAVDGQTPAETNEIHMKTVFDNAEIPHLWSAQAQPEGRNAKRSFYFEGATIYSHGPHFPIARHVVNRRGGKAVLFTLENRSVTTNRHKSRTHQAIQAGVPVFDVRNPDGKPEREALAGYESRALIAHKAAQRARSDWSREYNAKRAVELLAKAVEMAKFFGWRYTPPTLETLPAVIDKRHAADKRKAVKQERERRKRMEAEHQRVMERAHLALTLWLANDVNVDVYLLHNLPTAYARISGNELETTRDARVPLDHVRRAWPVIRELVTNGRAWHANGHAIKLGHYSIDSIDVQGTLCAGCHTFDKAEVLRIGGLIDGLDLAEKDSLERWQAEHCKA